MSARLIFNSVIRTFKKDVSAEVGPWMLLSLRLLMAEDGGRDELDY